MKAGGLVAVTGASGYIGRHFLRHQARKGQSVIAVVRRSLDLPDARDVRVADVTDWEALVRAFAGCDAVVHLACLPVARCQQDPTAGFRVNTLGTFYVLMAAREAGVRRVVYTSSAQVYGRPAVRPVPESAPCQPVTMYGASKLCGEVWCRTLARAGGPETVVLRLFNAYGPAADRTPRPTVETLFLRAVLAGQEPVVRGHPEHMRDFVHVSDVVRALDLALTTHWAAGQLRC
jgi:UDP-glucose 4-epimerase